jgi:hypothetical protein
MAFDRGPIGGQVGRVALPVSVMAIPGTPAIADLARVGVGRVSLAT